MKRCISKGKDSYKDMDKPESPKEKAVKSKEEALEKLLRGFQQ